MDTDTFRVVARNGVSYSRRVFEGVKEDAEKFLADNFPRIHVEPHSDSDPKPDAILVSPGGNADSGDGCTYFNGTAYVPVNGEAEPTASTNLDLSKSEPESVEDYVKSFTPEQRAELLAELSKESTGEVQTNGNA